MKRKRKRSASSSSSSSSPSSRASSSSSSSSSRRRSKKKKKKRRRSDRGSKRHRRISSKESRRSEEGKGEKEEEEELEWYPAPPNTSATFLNQKGGPRFEEEVRTDKDPEDRRISQLYSLSAASDEESDYSRRDRKRRDREEKTRSRKDSRSPEERRQRRDKSRERGKEESRRDRRDSDGKRRGSLDSTRNRRVSCSSADSEYSRSFHSEHSNFSSASRHTESKTRNDSTGRSSIDAGRYENRGQEEVREAKREGESEKARVEEESCRSERGRGTRPDGENGDRGGRSRKDLPANLLDIFSQIAQFEKERGGRPKK